MKKVKSSGNEFLAEGHIWLASIQKSHKVSSFERLKEAILLFYTFLSSKQILVGSGRRSCLFSSKLDVNLRKKLVKCYIWSIGVYGPENWIVRKAHHKYMESLRTWPCRRERWRRSVGLIVWWMRIKEERSILHKITREDGWLDSSHLAQKLFHKTR